MDDLLSEFLTETSEALAVLDVELVKFEQDSGDTEILGNIFRLVHTIKGTCGFLGLPRLESVAHAGENILGKFRDGVIDVTPEAVSLILKCLDCIRDLLGELEERGEEPEGEDQELIAELNAMILKEAGAQLQGWKIDIIGTDISTEILTKARSGLYTQFEVQRGLPIQLLMKYFEKQDDQWLICKDLRDMITYKEYNLLDDLSPLGRFDVVFCRNALIYFDQETKGKVLDGIADLMPDDGILFLGGAETVLGISERFKPKPEQRGVYGLVTD